jgi:nucleotide-binding universal stress UspA family protein
MSALEWARALADRAHPAVTVVHVDVDPFDPREMPREEARALKESLRHSLEKELRRILRETFGDAEPAVRVEVVTGDPADAIIAVARELDADLIVLGSTGKGAVERFLSGSVTQAVLQRSPLPTLVVH